MTSSQQQSKQENLSNQQSKPKCGRCGLCCHTAFLALHSVDIEDEKEIGKWLRLHRCDVSKYQSGDKEVLGVAIPIVCAWLSFDREEGKYKCEHYKERPLVCKEYFCSTSKREKYLQAQEMLKRVAEQLKESKQ